MKKIKTGRYRHFKGAVYHVFGTARHSEKPNEEFVVYQTMHPDKKFDENQLWIRPKRMFFERVVVDGKRVQRFRHLR